MATDRGIDKEAVVYICNGILLSHKKNDMMTFATTWIDQEIIILSEESENEKFHMILLMCGI